MEWRGGRESSNVEDRRGAGGMIAGGGIGSIVVAILYYLLSGSPAPQNGQQPNSPAPSTPGGTGQVQGPGGDSLSHFVRFVLAETEDVWGQLFQQQGARYTDPTLVMFTNRTRSACGIAQTAMGPFYCPEDQKVYIDLAFYQELLNRFHAAGDFAEAYVIAHEVGHHVQKLLGIADKVTALQQRASQREANDLSVRLELQADFFAGVWAHYEKQRGKLDPGDVDEALNAASAVGDDKIEQQTQGYVEPDTFTHGTAAQRSRWFKKGYDTGDMTQGDTFNADVL